MAGPLCFRLPPDLHAAVEHAASAAGITTSEWVRDMLFRIVYGTPPGIDEGYIAGRQLGYRVMNDCFRQACAATPPTVEEAMHIIQSGSPGRTGDQG